jgi:hypothetical protein
VFRGYKCHLGLYIGAAVIKSWLLKDAVSIETNKVCNTVICRPFVRERLGKQARNKYTTNSRGRPVLDNGRVSMGLRRDYTSSTEQNQNQNGASPQQSRKKSVAEDLL